MLSDKIIIDTELEYLRPLLRKIETSGLIDECLFDKIKMVVNVESFIYEEEEEEHVIFSDEHKEVVRRVKHYYPYEGLCEEYEKNKIKLQFPFKGKSVSKEKARSLLSHEVAHLKFSDHEMEHENLTKEIEKLLKSADC